MLESPEVSNTTTKPVSTNSNATASRWQATTYLGATIVNADFLATITSGGRVLTLKLRSPHHHRVPKLEGKLRSLPLAQLRGRYAARLFNPCPDLSRERLFAFHLPVGKPFVQQS
jgi:hypothetical protein